MTALEMTEGPLPLLLVIAACHCCLSLLLVIAVGLVVWVIMQRRK